MHFVEEELMSRLHRAATTPLQCMRTTANGQRAQHGAAVSFDTLFRKADEYLGRHAKRYAQLTSRLWTPAELFTSPLFDRGLASVAERHAIIDRIRDDAKHFRVSGGHGPNAFQIELIEFWLELSAPYIYGEFWQTDYVAIKQRNGWNTPNNGIGAVRSGRKDGKSTGIAMCVVLGMMNLPNYEVALFARVHKQSRIILGMAIQLAYAHPRFREFYMPRPSKDHFELHLGKNDRRMVIAHSGSETVMQHTQKTQYISMSAVYVCSFLSAVCSCV